MHTLTRRQWLQTAAAGAAALALTPRAARAADTGFTLPPLPYPFNALEPAIDAKTMEIHHDKHHAAYVKNLNDALAKHPELLKRPVGELLRDLKSLPVDEKTRTAVRNNGGGHYNHSLFWQIMGPHAGGEPTGPLGDAIKRDFRSFDAFKTEFKDYAMKRFGSGWAWLVAADGKLVITSTPNQDSTLTEGRRPLLGIDVWEHAYYLKYQNRRNEYVDAWWSVVNWKTAGERFARRA